MEESTIRPVPDEITQALWHAAMGHLQQCGNSGFGKAEGDGWFAEIRQFQISDNHALVIEAHRRDLPFLITFSALGSSGKASDDICLWGQFVDWFTTGAERTLSFVS